MNKRNKIVIVVLVLIILMSGSFLYSQRKVDQQQVACTADAKICPDGSSVGRTGPSCEFTECPTVTVVGDGILKGQVTVGPVCPEGFAEKYPTFSCTPTPEMYAAAKVFVYEIDKSTLVKTIIPDKDGKFYVSLKEGTYFIDMIHQKMGGTKGVPTTINIIKDKPVVLKLDVDTGLR